LLGKINNFDPNRVTKLETQVNNLDNTYATNNFVTESIDTIKGKDYQNETLTSLKKGILGLEGAMYNYIAEKISGGESASYKGPTLTDLDLEVSEVKGEGYDNKEIKPTLMGL
jgi:hypothetical protein